MKSTKRASDNITDHTSPYSPSYYKKDYLRNLSLSDQVDQLKKRVSNLEELLKEASDVFSLGNIGELVLAVSRFIIEKFVPECLVFMVEPNQTEGIQTTAYRNLQHQDVTIKLKSLDIFKEYFRSKNHISRFIDFENAIDYKEEVDQLKVFNPELVVPVQGFSGLYGLILFSKKVTGGSYTNMELEYIDRLMRFTSLAIQNTIHYRNSISDLKTGLFNSSYYVQRVREEIARSDRYGNVFSILIMDMDFFKNLNDKYGHLAGDHVLQKVADIIVETIRKEDIPSRFGGEEFALLLTNTAGSEAYITAERIRRAVETHVFMYNGKGLRTTISIGCYNYESPQNVDYKEILRRADSSLYSAKAAGRNMTKVYHKGLLYRASNL